MPRHRAIVGIAIACVTALAAAGCKNSAQVFEDQNEGGWFAKSDDGSWNELNEITFRKLGKPAKFGEAKRSNDFIDQAVRHGLRQPWRATS